MYIPRKRLFWSVSLGHLTNDIFMAMGPVLLAFIGTVYFPVETWQIGVAVSARQMLGAISQPVFGWLSDRGYGRFLGAGGVAWTASFVALSMLLAIVGNFWLMVIPFALSALGSAAFHPVGTANASQEGDEMASTDTAYFFLMGQTGLALGPAIAGLLLGMTVVDGEGGSVVPIIVLCLAAIPSVLFMRFAIPVADRSPEGIAKEKAAIAATPHKAIKVVPLVILAVMVLLRGLGYPGSVAFLPELFRAKGWQPEAYGGIVSMFWISSAVAGVFFGYLAARMDRRWVIVGSLLAVVPVYILLPTINTWLAYPMTLLMGALVGGSHSIIVVMAQELLPGRKGFASGVTLGFIFGVGALGTLIIGYIADGMPAFGIPGVGLERAFQSVSAFILLSSLMAFLLPTPDREPVVVVDSTLEPEGAD
ncbi:MAG: MFS transporter [Chloroflexota bacterium]